MSADERRDRLTVAAYRAGARVACALPRPVADRLPSIVGPVAARLLTERRRVVGRHVTRVHGPALSDSARAKRVDDVFVEYARYWLDAFRMDLIDPEDLAPTLTADGYDLLQREAERGGVILALPHLGAWDQSAAWMGSSTRYEVVTVVEPLEPPELLEWFSARRRRFGIDVVPLGPDAGRIVMQALGRGAVVGLFSDRDLQGGGVEVTFFGERTTIPAGPATLALRKQVPLMPIALYHGGPASYHAVIEPPLDTERRGTFRQDVARVSQDLVDALERLIRRAPAQWHLLQPNWPSDRA